MRWDELFGDLEGQLAEAERREWEAQLPDLTRRERSDVTLLARCAASIGRPVTLRTTAGTVHGELTDVGADWITVLESGRSDALVPTTALRAIAGLERRSAAGSRRFGLTVALRAISRDRAVVTVHDDAANVWTGTIDGVGKDHLDLAEHPSDAVRRREAVTGRRVIPYAGVAIVRRVHS